MKIHLYLAAALFLVLGLPSLAHAAACHSHCDRGHSACMQQCGPNDECQLSCEKGWDACKGDK